MSYYNWQKATKFDAIKYKKASPNLVEVGDWLVKRWGGNVLGIYNKRNVRGGDVPSSHSYGAALDWRYGLRRTAETVISFLIKYHGKLGVQVIIDYVGCRQWIAGSGWHKLEPNKVKGFGEPWAKWLHIETTKTAWGDKTPIEQR